MATRRNRGDHLLGNGPRSGRSKRHSKRAQQRLEDQNARTDMGRDELFVQRLGKVKNGRQQFRDLIGKDGDQE